MEPTHTERPDALATLLPEIRPGLELMGLAACVLDGKQRYRYANALYAVFIGRPVEALLGKSPAHVFGREPADDRRKALARALAGEALTFDRRTVEGPNAGRWVRAHYAPIRMRGAVVGVAVVLTDIQHLKEAEARVRDQQRQLRLITDSVGFPITYIDREGVVRFANDPSCAWAGLKRERMEGIPFEALAPPAVIAATAPLLERAFAGEAITYEREALWPGRESRRIRGHIIPDRDAEGTVRGVLVVVMDIEEDHRLKQSLIESRRWLQLVSDNVGVPMSYIDAQLRFRFANTPGLDWRAGLDTGSVAGRHLSEVFERDVVDEVMPHIGQALAGSQVVYERHGRSPGGTRRWIRVTLIPDRAPDGSIAGLYSIAIDIDDDRRLRDALERQERGLRFYAENIPEAVAFVGPDLRYQWVNKGFEAIRGESADAVIGRTVSDVLGDAAAEFFEPFIERLRSGTTCAYERFTGPPGGRRRWYRVRLVPVQGAAGEFGGYYIVGSDIHELKSVEEDLRRANGILSAHLENTPLAVIEWDPQLRAIRWSGRAESIFGWKADEILGRSLANWRLVFEDDQAAVESMVRRLAKGPDSQATLLNRNYRKDGSVIWVEWHNSAMRDAEGRFVSLLSLAQDVSPRIQAEERLQFMATHDGLTGLPNRLMLNERLGSAIARAQRFGSRVAVMFLDLDHFKDVNDTLGHRVGDELLRELARRVRATLRQSDLLVRLSGDEFVILLEDLEGDSGPDRVAQKILEDVMRPFPIEGHDVRVSASLGFAVYPEDGSDPDTLLKNADAAMYHAKELGRNSYRAFSHALAQRREERIGIEQALRLALRKGAFELHFQPILEVATGRVTHVEALLRWRDGKRGLVLPHAFIPLAEETGHMRELGHWVLEAASRQAVAWRNMGLAPFTVTINLSASQLRDSTIASELEGIVSRAGCSPTWLALEITETSMMRDLEGVSHTLGTLRRMGFRIAIDDFGTGFSSLSHLRHLPVDTLKIDKSFVADIDGSRRAGASGGAAIVAAVTGLARGLALEVVAEGVERPEQLEFLKAHGCTSYQGYLACRPLPAVEFEAWLARNAVPALAEVKAPEGARVEPKARKKAGAAPRKKTAAKKKAALRSAKLTRRS